jgi:hypothetical protein
MVPAGGDFRMMVLEKSPHFAKRRKVVDLRGRELSYNYARAIIELVIAIENGCDVLDLGKFPDRPAIDQKL